MEFIERLETATVGSFIRWHEYPEIMHPDSEIKKVEDGFWYFGDEPEISEGLYIGSTPGDVVEFFEII